MPLMGHRTEAKKIENQKQKWDIDNNNPNAEKNITNLNNKFQRKFRVRNKPLCYELDTRDPHQSFPQTRLSRCSLATEKWDSP